MLLLYCSTWIKIKEGYKLPRRTCHRRVLVYTSLGWREIWMEDYLSIQAPIQYLCLPVLPDFLIFLTLLLPSQSPDHCGGTKSRRQKYFAQVQCPYQRQKPAMISGQAPPSLPVFVCLCLCLLIKCAQSSWSQYNIFEKPINTTQ